MRILSPYVEKSVLRQALIALIILSLIKIVCVKHLNNKKNKGSVVVEFDPWYTNKVRPSFLDMLAEFLERALGQKYFSHLKLMSQG